MRSCTVIAPAFCDTKDEGVMMMDAFDLLSLISCMFSFISLLIAVYDLGRRS